MPAFELIYNLLEFSRIAQYILIVIVLTAGGLLLNYIASEMEILNTTTYVVALIYVVLMSCSSEQTVFNPVIFSNLFMMLVLLKLMGTHRKEKAFSDIFDAGFLLALSTLFYFPSFLFIPIVWIALVLLRPFVWREWLIGFLGFVLPYIFVGIIYFFIDKFDYLWYDKIFYPMSARQFIFTPSPKQWILLGFLVFLTLLSLTRVFRGVTFSTMRARNNLFILLWFLILAVGSSVAAPSWSVTHFSFLALPFTILFANYFLSIRRTGWAEWLFFVFIALALVNQMEVKIY